MNASNLNKIEFNLAGLLSLIGGFILLIGIWSSWTVINPGYSGVVFNQMTGNMHTVGQGITLRIPFVTKVRSYPVALRTYSLLGEESIDLPTREGQHIKQDLTMTYNTSPGKAAEVFRNFKGVDIEDIEITFVRRSLMTIAQNIAGQMSLQEVISSNRGELQARIEKEVTIELNKMGFVVDKVMLGASHLPATIEEQMQQKMAAQQKAQQAEYELQKQQLLAKAAVATATGEAQSLLVKAEAQSKANQLLQQSLTALLVENKKIEKWDGKLPQITGGAMPFVNFNHEK